MRRAFTLVEMLVVIAIIGVLVAMLLPAVQAAREAARRIQCQSHQKQLALGVQNYSDSLRAYPASGIVDTDIPSYDSKSGSMISWAVLILPFIQQKNLHEQFNFKVSVLAQPAADPQAAQVPVFRCPSDAAKGLFFQDAALTNNRRLAKGNYAAFVSPFHVEFQSGYRAALTSHRVHTDATFASEGTTTTLLLTEVRTRAFPSDQRGAWAIAWCGASQLAYDVHDEGPFPLASSGSDLSRGQYNPDPNFLNFAQVPNNQGPLMDMLYDCPAAADAQLRRMPCHTWSAGTDNFLSAAPRSLHPGGVNAVYVDGHVGFLPHHVDRFTLACLISVEDARPVELP